MKIFTETITFVDSSKKSVVTITHDYCRDDEGVIKVCWTDPETNQHGVIPLTGTKLGRLRSQVHARYNVLKHDLPNPQLQEV